MPNQVIEMANPTYDLDVSGGLMPQIQALLAPPSLEDITKDKKKDGLALHPYYKRPGRGHNRDCCDACKEGGGLICCDSCPASFHLQCHDPPLEESSLPKGLWHCHSCRTRKADETSDAVVKTNESEEEEELDFDGNRNGKRLLNSAGSSQNRIRMAKQSQPGIVMKRRRTNNSDETDTDVTVKLEKVSEDDEMKDVCEKNSFLAPLIKAAASMNPQQFELPPELVEPIPFPGSSKGNCKKPGQGLKKKSHELDNGFVPLPIRACFYCSKSCRVAPMLACDYCPLVFHLDCLDPPLVCMPVGRWMCPNHPQNLEYKKLPDSRLTERVKFWSFLQRPIDQESVKVNFLRKINRKNPPFRLKVQLPGRSRIKVPQIIKDQYKHPPLLPARLNGSQPFFWSSILPETLKVIANDTDPSGKGAQESLSQVADADRDHCNGSQSSHSSMDGSGDDDDLTTNSESRKPFPGISEEELTTIEGEVKNYLASLRRNIRERGLKIFMEQLSNDLLSTLDSETMRLLAMQRVQQLILNPESRSLTVFPFPDTFSSANKSPTTTVNQPWLQSADVSDTENSVSNAFPCQPRAFLCPLSSAYPPTPVYYRQFTVGTGANMDLVLGSFGSCSYVSGHHATIFYDEMSRHFELLNYSEHGTVVDNVVYCCDVTVTSKSIDETPKEEGGGVVDAKEKQSLPGLNDLLKRKVADVKSTSETPHTTIDSTNQVARCGCQTSCSAINSSGAASSASGWEGTALLTHGSHIKFGCLQFILCISNTNEKPRFIHQ